MNKNIVVILSALVSLIIGYHLYPFLNETQLEESSSNNTDAAVLPNKQSSVPKDTIQPSQSNNKTKTLAVGEQSSSNKNVDDSLNQQQIPSATSIAQTDNDSEEMNVENSEQIAGLKNWSENHKKNLKELVDNNLPAERAQELMRQIMTDNPFLNESVVKQDVNTDEEWSYKMTEIINNQISENRYGLDIEVLSLTCKQLTCELILRELVKGSWFEVYIPLLKYFHSNQYSLQNKGQKQFRFDNGEEILFYVHLIFLK